MNPQGSKAQLEQVWEETDGLDAKDFDPRTFFKLHGKMYFCSMYSFVVYDMKDFLEEKATVTVCWQISSKLVMSKAQ